MYKSYVDVSGILLSGGDWALIDLKESMRATSGRLREDCAVPAASGQGNSRRKFKEIRYAVFVS